MIPFIAVGNDELGEQVGETIICKQCGQHHAIEYGDKILPDGTKEPTKLLAFYTCGKVTYLCAINGMLLP